MAVGKPVQLFENEDALPLPGIIIDVSDEETASLVFYSTESHDWQELHDVPKDSNDDPEGPFWKDEV